MAYFQNGAVIATQGIFQVSSGIAPIIVNSSTLVTNLNADLLDGQSGSYYTNAANLTGILPNGLITDANHGTRGGGNLHAEATETTDGFMSATDKLILDNMKLIPTLVTTATTTLQVGNVAFIQYNGATLNVPGVGNVTFGQKIQIVDYKGVFDQTPCILASNLFEGTNQSVTLSIRKKIYTLMWIDSITGYVIL